MAKGIRSRTWLIAVFKGKECLFAEKISGSANYISLLVDTCHLITTVAKDIQEWSVELMRGDLAKDTDTEDVDSWHKTLTARDIEIFEGAYKASHTSV